MPSMHALNRFNVEDVHSTSVPLSHNLSWVKHELHEAVVTARKSAWWSVRERESLMGVLWSVDALPQYFMQAMFVGAETVAV